VDNDADALAAGTCLEQPTAGMGIEAVEAATTCAEWCDAFAAQFDGASCGESFVYQTAEDTQPAIYGVLQCPSDNGEAVVEHEGTTIAEVGGSGEQVKSITVPVTFPECPTRVDNSNWLDGFTYADYFLVERSDDLTTLTITRNDTQGEGWGMNLRFDCGDDLVGGNGNGDGDGQNVVTDWTIAGNAETGWPYFPINGENGCEGAQEGCGGYYCCGDPKCNLVRECGGLAGCACPIEGEPEPHPVVPVAGENGCDNPQEGCGGHYCCGDTRCNLGRTCGGLHHCACPMFGGEPTTTAPPATLCNSVPIDCLDGIDLTVAGLTDECAAAAAPYFLEFAACLTCVPLMTNASTVCPACKQAGHDHFVVECAAEIAAAKDAESGTARLRAAVVAAVAIVAAAVTLV